MRAAAWILLLSALCMSSAASASLGVPHAPGVPLDVTNMSVLAYGAKCDGVADDTVRIQAALDAGRLLYVPANKTCVTSNLTVTNANTQIRGDGPSSVLSFKAGSTGYHLTADEAIDIDGIRFAGGNDSSRKAEGTAGNRSAISMLSQTNSSVRNSTIHGYTNVGINFADASRDRLNHVVVSNTAVYNNHKGMVLGPNNAEYIRISDVDVHNNAVGIELSSGNVFIANAKVNDNGIGVDLIGTDIGNNGHGTFVGGNLNHSGTYSLRCTDITVGFAFVGVQIHDGPILLDNCDGVSISEGEINVQSICLDGGGQNIIRDNTITGDGSTYANTVTHTCNGNADDTIVTNNRKTVDGTWLDNNATTGGLITLRGVSTAFLDVGKTSESGAPEKLLRMKVSDATSEFGIQNNTSGNSLFDPAFYGYQPTGYTTNRVPLAFISGIHSTLDSGTIPVMQFQARQCSTDIATGCTAVTTRPILTIGNWSSTYVVVEAAGLMDVRTGLYDSTGPLVLNDSRVHISGTAETSAPAGTDCDADAEVGTFVRYSKSAGATISICICTKSSSTYSWTALGTGDCT